MRQTSSIILGRPWVRALMLIFVVVGMFSGNVAEARFSPCEDQAEQTVLTDVVDVTSPSANHFGAASSALHCNSGSVCVALLPAPAVTPPASASDDDIVFTQHKVIHASPIFGLFRPPRRA